MSAAMLLVLAALASPARMAVTVDDLPWVGSPLPEGRGRGNQRILATLQKHHVPATGFVNCDRLSSDEQILRFWTDAGMDLGNHQAAHDDLNKVPEAAWLDGARRCDAFLRVNTGKSPRYFRHPYLFYGPTPEVRDRVTAALTGEMGYALAHVTIDNLEWKVAQLYGKALDAHDDARAADLAAWYVPHMLAAVSNFQAVAQRKLGRDVSHVLLMHDNRLNADHLDDLLTALEGQGHTFMPLSEALSDPVYALPSAYEGRRGISWLYRIAPVDVQTAWDDAQEEALNDRFPSGKTP